MTTNSLVQCRALLARQQSLHQQQHKRLARRIHDDISQQLTLLSLQLSLALLDATPPANWAQSCKNWSALVLELGQSLRHIINELQPRVLDEVGFGAALQWYVRSCPKGVQCTLHMPDAPVCLPPSSANELFAICCDIIGEVLAPNGVTAATIVVEQTDESLRLHFRVNEKNPTMALLAPKELETLSMQERLLCLDGSLQTHQSSEEGFAITLTLPASRQPISHAA